MMLSRHGLRRPWFLEFECFCAVVSVLWGLLAYGTALNMAERPTLGDLAFLSDDQWAVLMCSLGVTQFGLVLVNRRWGRWLVSVPLCLIWCSITNAIVQAWWAGVPPPLADAFYIGMSAFLLLKVIRLPREFPPRG